MVICRSLISICSLDHSPARSISQYTLRKVHCQEHIRIYSGHVSPANGQAKLLVVTTDMVRSHLCACAVTSVIAVTAAIMTPFPAAAPGGGLGQA